MKASRVRRQLLIAVVVLEGLLLWARAGAVPSPSGSSSTSGITRFTLDGNRVYSELAFVRADGSLHRALAFVDMGGPRMALSPALFHELHLDRGRTLNFKVGGLDIQLPAASVSGDADEAYSLGGDLKVEAVLAAGVLENYEVGLDYKARTLTLAAPGTLKPEGTPVPFRIKTATGLIAVDALIDGKTYPVTIDNGSAYTWFRGDLAKSWLARHREWERGVGAVGEADMMMSGKEVETQGVLVRLPKIRLGTLPFKNVGVLAAGKGTGFLPNQDLFDWYSTKNAAPVIGWIGGNVLKNFRLNIDYAARKIYWLRQSGTDDDDLNTVGLTLRAAGGDFLVAAIATKNGKATVASVQAGDKLVRINSLETKGATWGAIYDQLQGAPGEVKSLSLERAGKAIPVRTAVTAF